MLRELEDKLIIGHVYENVKIYNMPGGVLVTRQAVGHGVCTPYSLLWHLLPLFYSLCDVCKVKCEILSIANLQTLTQGLGKRGLLCALHSVAIVKLEKKKKKKSAVCKPHMIVSMIADQLFRSKHL